MFKHGLLWSSVVVLGVAACGESSSSGGAQGVALQDVPEAYAKTVCEAFLRCNPLIASLLREPDCLDLFQNTLQNQGYDDLESAIEDGRATFDGKLMESCLNSLSNRDCASLDDPEPQSCRDAVKGTVARGDDCTTDFECEGDSVCSFDASCPGTCSARLNAGELCSSDDQCQEGLECADDTGRCVAPAAEGEDCEGGVAPECAGETLTCVGADDDESRAGTCTPNDEVYTEQVGDACDIVNGPWCVEGAACVFGEITAAGVTFECREVAADGEACSLGLPNPCQPGSLCSGIDPAALDFEGTCEPTLSPGDECAVDQPFMCGFAAACVVGADGLGRCIAKKDNGLSCTVAEECWSENCASGGCAPTSACN